MTILISGGAGSGKSALAQQAAVTLSPEGRRYYLATMLPADGEDRRRIARHVAQRSGLGFATVERSRAVCAGPLDGGGTYLLDSVTALLTNEMFPAEQGYALNPEAAAQVTQELLELMHRVKNVVFVSDSIYADAEPYGESTEYFRRALAEVNIRLAQACDTVAEAAAGQAICYKGRLNSTVI